MSTIAQDLDVLECCMCGDYGLSQNLFRCRVCRSRFQHSYCSNLYPKAENNMVCNWCLHKRGDKIKQIEHSYSSAKRNNSNEGGEENNKKIKKNNGNNGRSVPLMKIKRDGVSVSQLHVHVPMKKQRVNADEFIERKKIVQGAQSLKSEVIVKTGKIQPVFRAKVQRYKLLEEVSVR